MFDNPFDPWGAPQRDDGCLGIVGRIPGAGTIADGDTYIASDGTRWRRIHSMVDAMSTSPAAPRRWLRNGKLCNH